jgi:hypothetical protein
VAQVAVITVAKEEAVAVALVVTTQAQAVAVAVAVVLGDKVILLQVLVVMAQVEQLYFINEMPDN